MKYSFKFFITALITGVLGVIQSFVTINEPDLLLSERIITYGLMGIIIYGIPVAIVVYFFHRRSIAANEKKKIELELAKAAEDKELADAEEKKLADEKRKKAEKEIITLKEDVEKDVQKYSSELEAKVETLEKEALSLIEVVQSEVQTLDDLESRHKQIGKIVKSRKKDDGNSEDIKEIKNLLKKINP